jgi:hypothetical protein
MRLRKLDDKAEAIRKRLQKNYLSQKIAMDNVAEALRKADDALRAAIEEFHRDESGYFYMLSEEYDLLKQVRRSHEGIEANIQWCVVDQWLEDEAEDEADIGDVVAPNTNGKLLRNCNAADCRAAGGWFNKLADKLDGKSVGEWCALKARQQKLE